MDLKQSLPLEYYWAEMARAKAARDLETSISGSTASLDASLDTKRGALGHLAGQGEIISQEDLGDLEPTASAQPSLCGGVASVIDAHATELFTSTFTATPPAETILQQSERTVATSSVRPSQVRVAPSIADVASVPLAPPPRFEPHRSITTKQGGGQDTKVAKALLKRTPRNNSSQNRSRDSEAPRKPAKRGARALGVAALGVAALLVYGVVEANSGDSRGPTRVSAALRAGNINQAPLPLSPSQLISRSNLPKNLNNSNAGTTTTTQGHKHTKPHLTTIGNLQSDKDSKFKHHQNNAVSTSILPIQRNGYSGVHAQAPTIYYGSGVGRIEPKGSLGSPHQHRVVKLISGGESIVRHTAPMRRSHSIPSLPDGGASFR